ncbi:MAG: O-antigen ligase family protein [Candidatus Latescibacteria bacterium]|nr:O-antigen ligase family protein [Candidatus Latescibacterota bacterium]
MRTAQVAAAAGRRTALLALGPLPVLGYLALRALGLTKLALWGVMGLVAAAGAIALFVRPRWGVYFLAFHIYSGLGMFLPVNLAAPAMAIAIAAVLLEWLRGTDLHLPDPAFLAFVGLFFLIALGSVFVARDAAATFLELIRFGKVLLLIALVVHLCRRREHLRWLCYAVFAGAACTVILGIMGLVYGITGDDAASGVSFMRFAGAHENPNKAAAYMCSSIPLGVFAMKFCSARWGRALFTVGLVVIFGAIFATFSRSVVIALTAVVLGVIIRELRTRPRSFGLLALLLAIGILLAPRYFWDRVVNLPDALRDTRQDWSVYTRMLALQTAWEMFLDNPLTGIGLGNFVGSSAYRLFVRIVVHNTYLEILVGTGILGLTLFLGILGSGLRHAIAGARRRWNSQPEWVQSMSYYVALAGISIFLSAFFGTISFQYPLWVPVAAGLVIGNLIRADQRA